MNTVWASRRGYKALVEKRARLLEEIRQTQKQLGDAVRRDNDLRENPEYLELSTRLDSVLYRQLKELTAILDASKIFEDSFAFGHPVVDRVSLGTRVTVEENDGRRRQYVLVGFQEPDARDGDLSYLSPLGQALMAKEVGEELTVDLPGGRRFLRVLLIERDERFTG